MKWYGTHVKGNVTIRNNTFKIKDARWIFKEALCRATVENQKDCVLHCRYFQEEDFIKKDIRDEVIQRFVIILQDKSDRSFNETEKKRSYHKVSKK